MSLGHNLMQCLFLPREAMHYTAYAMARCLSVRLDVCHVRVLYGNG